METRIERIEKDLKTINSFTATPGKGITRFTFSREYQQARSYIVEELKKIGAHLSTTMGGNLRGRLEGSEKGRPVVMMGSHIDSVFQGGRFDGVAGVVSALEAARVIAENKIPHSHPIDVVVFAEEEGSRFGSVMLGSRAWAGKLSLQDLRQTKDKDGVIYTTAMEESGIIPDDLSSLKPEQIKAMLELHVEQSVVLESKSIQIGIVEAIAGIKQFLATIQGVPNHAGGTPMGLRFDALQGAARIIAAAEEIASREMGKNTVATVGYLNCQPGQANVIPGMVQFTLDIRDPDPGTLEKATKKILSAVEKTCQDRRLAYEIKPRSDTPPVVLSKKIAQLIEEIAHKRNIQTLRMISGALHDSSIIAEFAEVGMIFVSSKDGRSHCPEEYTELQDIKLGADILLSAVGQLSF
jgi:allantoate deiminase